MKRYTCPDRVISEIKPAFVTRIRGPKDEDLVLKVGFDVTALGRNMQMRENEALRILKGLAVPNRVFVSKKWVQKYTKTEKFCHVTMDWVPGEGCFGKVFTVEQALALWLFTIEQMCAFHRNKILYTDFKHNHLRVTKDFTSACLVDFGGCVMVEANGLYPMDCIGYTPELAPPEFQFLKQHSERVLVYQMGMFLGALLIGHFHNSDISLKSISKIKEKLRAKNMDLAFSLFETCISSNPADRAPDLESLFSALQGIPLPIGSYRIWHQLRAPDSTALSKVGLFDERVDVPEAA